MKYRLAVDIYMIVLIYWCVSFNNCCKGNQAGTSNSNYTVSTPNQSPNLDINLNIGDTISLTLLNQPHYRLFIQRNSRKPFQSCYIRFRRKLCAFPYKLFQVLKVTHEKARCNRVDKDTFFVEGVAKFMRETNWDLFINATYRL